MTREEIGMDDRAIAAALESLAAEWHDEDGPSVEDLDALAEIIGR